MNTARNFNQYNSYKQMLTVARAIRCPGREHLIDMRINRQN
jgi:hypothetical protein